MSSLSLLNIEKYLFQLSLEREEAERRELRKMMMESPKKKNKDDSVDSPALPPGVSDLHILLNYFIFIPCSQNDRLNMFNRFVHLNRRES